MTEEFSTPADRYNTDAMLYVTGDPTVRALYTILLRHRRESALIGRYIPPAVLDPEDAGVVV